MNAQRRIFHLITSGEVLAGAEQLLVSMARIRDRLSWELAVCTVTGRGQLHEALEALGIEVHALNVRRWNSLPGALLRLRSVLTDFRPDVFHSHLSHASILAATVQPIVRCPLFVQTRHYSDYVARFQQRRLFADAWAARRYDRVIAVSEGAKAQLVNRERVPASRVKVVENGVEWERLSKLDRVDARCRLEELGVGSGLKIGCAATFNVRKGHTYLFQAMCRVRDHHPDAQLVLLGTGDDEQRSRAEVQRLGIANSVHFLGHRSDGQLLMAGLDVYVQPSIEEGFGLALVEAMAMGLPVVATNVGGMLKTVEPDRSGLRVPPGDAQALAVALLALAANPEHAAQLGRNASERVHDFYSIERMLLEYEAVYVSRSLD